MSTVRREQFQNFLTQTKWSFKQHQFEGYEWVINKELNENMGCIIGDDMGLGKTPTALAHILSRNASKPTLVICPLSVVHNWESEAKKFRDNGGTLIGTYPTDEYEFN